MMFRRRRQRGFAIVSVLLLTMMVMLTAGMVLIPSFMGRSASIQSGTAMKSGNIADAGLDFGLAALNSTVSTGSNSALANLPTFFVQGTGGSANTWSYQDSANANFFRNNFERTIPVLTVRIPTAIPMPGGTGVASDYRIVRSEATVSGALKRVEAIVIVRRTSVDNPISPFPRAITARGNVDANGSGGTLRTDSYDSSLGAYGGANNGTNGGVHTNGSMVGGGLYEGNVSAVGTIDPGLSVAGAGNTIRPGASAESIPDPSAAPTITTTSSTSGLPRVIASAAGAVTDLGAVSLSGNASKVLTLNPGKYIMSSLSISGQASILCAAGGPVEIWVTGNIGVTGNGIANASQLPANLIVRATNPTASVSMAGNGNFFGVIQAPNNAVTVGGNGEFFGAVVANTFQFNGSNSIVHYDDAVGRAFTTMASVSRPSQWQTLAINMLDKNN
ncbi:MAG: hypothetical protein H7338_23395 [Candidatus Sericytochromatia bacterium]|nr:hypothetical protein [Candidatus Sericytochromatia bacterium]